MLDTLIVFLKEFLIKFNFEKSQLMTKNHDLFDLIFYVPVNYFSVMLRRVVLG